MKKIILILLVLFSVNGFSQNVFSGDNAVRKLTATDSVVTQYIKITGGSPGNTKFLASDGSGNGSWQIIITESTYTPTLFNTTNVAASTAYVTHYYRIGDMVIVFGKISIDATTELVATELGMSLPISSAVDNDYELAGTGFNGLDNTGIQIIGDVTNDRAKFILLPQTNTNNVYTFSFTYKWIAP